MLDAQSAKCQIDLLLEHYPRLSIIKEDSSQISLGGEIDIYRSANNFILNKTYKIQIEIYLNRDDLPSVKDCENAISQDYPHRYKDGTLCVETETAIRLRFIDQFNLLQWMDEYVEVYYFSYEYFKRYGAFPFGERPHGLQGMIHTYQDIFNEPDTEKLCKLMVYVYGGGSYRGHQMCPCGSGKKLRDCHGESLFKFLTDSRYHKVLEKDIDYIIKSWEKNNKK